MGILSPYDLTKGGPGSGPQAGGSAALADKDAAHRVVRYSGDVGVNVSSWEQAKEVAAAYMKEQGGNVTVTTYTMKEGKQSGDGQNMMSSQLLRADSTLDLIKSAHSRPLAVNLACVPMEKA